MAGPARIVTELPAGWTFPPVPIVATPETVKRYIAAVGEGSIVPNESGIELAPPSAVVAFCLSACLRQVGLPSDAVHFAQEFEVHSPVAVGDELTLNARIVSKRRIASAGQVEMSFDLTAGDGGLRLSGRAYILLPSGVGD